MQIHIQPWFARCEPAAALHWHIGWQVLSLRPFHCCLGRGSFKARIAPDSDSNSGVKYEQSKQTFKQVDGACPMTPGTSDYGSDFTSDEEEILNALLHPVPEHDDNPNSDSNLVLKDIEDEQGHRGARVPYSHGPQSQTYPLLPVAKTRDTVQLDSGESYPASSTFCADYYNQTNTD